MTGRRADDIFNDALNLDPAERTAFLAEACAGDKDLRAEVESLLAVYEKAPELVGLPSQTRQGMPTCIGPYPVLGELGRGGMGVVYLAEDQRLKRHVALKVLPEHLARDPDRRASFEREAQLLAAVNHPNIATIHSLEEADGRHFLTMEVISGDTLADLLASGSLPLRESLRICRQVVDALEAAHDVGVMHRDLKPLNIMVTSSGLVKVVDFGLAKKLESYSVAPDMTPADDPLSGTILGTPGYMSPEQLRGESIDHQADMWALGCIFYECLAGQPAFPGKTAERILNTLECDPDWNALPAGTSTPIRDLIRRSLLKDVRERLATIGDARNVIEEEINRLTTTSLTHQPTARAKSEPPNNLPARLSSFIGRDKEIADIRRLLKENRLVTLTGAGGCGKTRLALEVADQLLQTFSDGVWMIELASVLEPLHVTSVVAGELHITEEPGTELVDTLVSRLKETRALLILDNCEHLLEPCRVLVSVFLQGCRHIRIVATSREPLGIEGEITYRVPSLSLPKADGPISMRSAVESESVNLFVERAKAVNREFELVEPNADLVVEVCSRLDGIPLAIELAAARIRVLSVSQICERLTDRFRLLIAGRATVLPRHRTLRAAIEWSYGLLDEQEKRLLRSLSVFVGGWDLAGLTAVCGFDRDEFEMLDLLTGLVDKSLVMVDRGTIPRYRLQETLWEYAQEALDQAGEGPETRDRHTEWFLSFAEKAERMLSGPEQHPWLDRLDADHENLLAAIGWCESTEGGEEKALRLAGSIWRFWDMRGHYRQGRVTIGRVLERSVCGAKSHDRDSAAFPAARAKVLHGAGVLAFRQRDFNTARELHGQSLALYRQLGDKVGIAASLNVLGVIAEGTVDYAGAQSHFEESLSLRRELGNVRGVADCLMNLGVLALRRSDYEEARALCEESLEIIKRELGDKWGMAMALTNLGVIAYSQGDFETARLMNEQALKINRELGSIDQIATNLHNLGVIAEYRNDNIAARAFYEEALASWRNLENKLGMAETTRNLGRVASETGDFGAAIDLHEESLQLSRALGLHLGIDESLEAVAELMIRLDAGEQAVRLLSSAEHLRGESGARFVRHEQARRDRALSAARSVTGKRLFARAWQQGREATWQDAIEMALQWLRDRRHTWHTKHDS